MSEPQVCLFFHLDRNGGAELCRLDLCLHSASDRVSLRRGRFTLVAGSGTFPWTAGVKGLTALFIRNHLFYVTRLTAVSPMLTGGRGSLASSLDYAITKNPEWLSEVFGSDKNGSTNARRYLKVENPNLKRPGPLTVHLNTKLISPNEISVFFEGEKVSDHHTILRLLNHIEGATNGDNLTDPDKSNLAQSLRPIYEEEVRAALGNVFLFEDKSLLAELRRLATHPFLQGLSGDRGEWCNGLHRKTTCRQKLGLVEDYALIRQKLEPLGVIKIFSSPMVAGSLAIFSYLRHRLHLNFELDWTAPHSVETLDWLTKHASKEHGSLAVLSVTSAAKLAPAIKRKTAAYVPVMLMPKISHAALVPSSSSVFPLRRASGTCFLFDGASTPRLALEDLSSSGHVRWSQASHHETHELGPKLSRILEGDNFAIRAFPYYKVDTVLRRAQPGKGSARIDLTYPAVLMAHREFMRNPGAIEAVELAVRDAWLSLAASEQSIAEVTRTFVDDNFFARCVYRFSGMNYEQ